MKQTFAKKLVLATVFIPLLVSSCKDEKAQQTIKDLELEITSLNERNTSLNAQYEAGRPRPGSLTPEEAAALKQRISDLNEELQRLAEFETKCQVLERELAAAKARLAEAILLPSARSNSNATTSAEMLNAIQDKNGTVISAVTNAVLIIEGDQSNGTGFMAKSGGKMYFYTAAHVLSGNTKLVVKSTDGTKYSKFGVFEYAEGADLVRMEVADDVKHYLEIVDEKTDLPLQAEIAALGNGGGAGVVTMEKGRIMGSSGESIEVDAGIIQGNSGGPVIHMASGKVVGLVTHLTSARGDIWSAGTRQGEVRRFACRLNKAWSWQPMKIGSFLAEAKAMTDYDQTTRLCFAIAALEALTNGMRMDASVGDGSKTVMNIFDENKEAAIVKSIIKMNADLGSKKMSTSEQDLKKQFKGVLGQAISLAKRSEDAMKADSMSWFHRQEFKDSQEARKKALELLNARIAALN
jgi:S1-C subfamily serine protease